MASSELTDAEDEAMNAACDKTHPQAVIERLCFKSGWLAARDYYKAEREREEQEPAERDWKPIYP